MKQHIGPIYLILGLMAVSALTIGAGDPHPPSQPQQAAHVHDLLPSPLELPRRVQQERQGIPKPHHRPELGAAWMPSIEAKVAKALAIAKARKAS